MKINNICSYKQNFSGVMSQSTYECFLKKYPELLLSNRTKIISDDCFNKFIYRKLDNIADYDAIDDIYANNPYVDSDFVDKHWHLDFSIISGNDLVALNPKFVNPKTKLRGYRFKDGTIVTSQGDKFKPVKTNEFKEALSFVPLEDNLYLKAYTQFNPQTCKPSRKFELLTEEQFKKVIKGNKKIHGKSIDFDEARELLGY